MAPSTGTPLERGDDRSINSDIAAWGVHFHPADVPGSDVCPVHEFAYMDDTGQSHVRILLHLVPPFRCHASMRA